MGRIPGLTTPLVQNHVPDSQSSPLHGEGETELSERSWIQNKYAVGSRRVQGQGDAIRRPGIPQYTESFSRGVRDGGMQGGEGRGATMSQPSSQWRQRSGLLKSDTCEGAVHRLVRV